MENPELMPLEEGGCQGVQARAGRAAGGRQAGRYGRGSCMKGPLKAVRLLLLVTVLPALFIMIPMYMRYRVFSGQMYPVGMTDMRMIDNKISTTWCQRQVVRSNATFNAFLVSEKPNILRDLVPVTMTRHLTLQDDMKEYWGFYLLEGSVVTVSTCVRWPGASLTMIKGHKHLQECAYIGDDSSEELEELLEANQRGLLQDKQLLERIRVLLHDDSPANDPDAMKRHKSGVRFHDPAHAANEANTLVQQEASSGEPPDVTDHEPQELREILERLHARRREAGAGGAREKTVAAGVKGAEQRYVPPAHLVSLPALHRHRDTNVDRDERQWLTFNDLDGNSTVEELTDATDEGKGISEEYVATDNTVEDIKYSAAANNLTADAEGNIDAKHSMESRMPSSAEVYENILNELQNLGPKGQRVLERLSNKTKDMINNNESNVSLNNESNVKINYESNVKINNESNFKINNESNFKIDTYIKNNNDMNELSSTTIKSELMMGLDDVQAEMKLNELRKILVEAIDEETRKSELKKKRHTANVQAREKRELLIQQAQFQKSLNDDDEERNLAQEEGLEPDGIADDHRVVNETTAFDMSNSEFWSSFSSSEEALLECEGLVLNLPLTPHPLCSAAASDTQHARAAQHNAVTYRVPANGYYFFVFNSENEVQTNYVRVRFELQRAEYDVRRSVLECRNYTERCELPLHFFSGEKVVLEVPLRDNDSLWNEEFVVISECEPRTSVYLACVVAVPFLVVVFAFQ